MPCSSRDMEVIYIGEVQTAEAFVLKMQEDGHTFLMKIKSKLLEKTSIERFPLQNVRQSE